MHPWGFCSGGERGGEERSKKGRQQQFPFSLPLPPSPSEKYRFEKPQTLKRMNELINVFATQQFRSF